MTLSNLLAILSQSNQNDLSIVGEYGKIEARLDGGHHLHTREPTYQVEAEYRQQQGDERVRVRQSGFRFSTVCCLCATVCLGEGNVDLQVIGSINEQFA